MTEPLCNRKPSAARTSLVAPELGEWLLVSRRQLSLQPNSFARLKQERSTPCCHRQGALSYGWLIIRSVVTQHALRRSNRKHGIGYLKNLHRGPPSMSAPNRLTPFQVGERMAKHKNVKRFASDVASSAGSEITASAPITTSADKRCLSRWKSVPSKRILLRQKARSPR